MGLASHRRGGLVLVGSRTLLETTLPTKAAAAAPDEASTGTKTYSICNLILALSASFDFGLSGSGGVVSFSFDFGHKCSWVDPPEVR